MVASNIQRTLRAILAAACLVMVVSLSAQVYSYRGTARVADHALELKALVTEPQEMEIAARDVSGFESLASSSLFFPPQDRTPPPPQLSGLLGDYALLNGRACAVGDKVGGWVIEKITDSAVVVSLDGKEKTLTAFASRDDLNIDNRPKKEQVDATPGRFVGPEGEEGPPADSAQMEAWRERMARERARRGGRTPAWASPSAGPFLKSLEGMTPEQVEQAIRDRFGGELPPGMDSEGIRSIINKSRSKQRDSSR
jgi:hypothetical protein